LQEDGEAQRAEEQGDVDTSPLMEAQHRRDRRNAKSQERQIGEELEGAQRVHQVQLTMGHL
jgi:hypothetical protein